MCNEKKFGIFFTFPLSKGTNAEDLPALYPQTKTLTRQRESRLVHLWCKSGHTRLIPLCICHVRRVYLAIQKTNAKRAALKILNWVFCSF